MNPQRLLTTVLLLLSILTVAADDSIPLRTCRPRAVSTDRLPILASPTRADGPNPYLGERHQLVVLVSFSDQQFAGDETATLEQWGKIFNQENFDEPPFKGSVYDYFLAQSYGQFQIVFDLYYIPLSTPRSKYRSTSTSDENTKYLIVDIAAELDKLDIEWSQYDWNRDDYIDQLLVVYAGKGSGYGGFGGDYDAIWPHQWWISYFKDYEAYTLTSGYVIDSYCCVMEKDSKDGYGTFGTICHEYSHCFGFPDMYYGSNNYVAQWDLMSIGNRNDGGYCPPCFSAHERWLLGWMTPTELTEPATITGMNDLATTPEAYLIRNEGHKNEYYIVENRQPTGWDASLPGSGIVVFHVDYDEVAWAGVSANAGGVRYSIFPANNATLEPSGPNSAYPYLTNNQLTDTSAPAASLRNKNTDDTRLMHKPITEMAVTSGLGSFVFMGGQTSVDRVGDDASDGQAITAIYTLSGQRVTEPAKGTYIIRYANGRTGKLIHRQTRR